MRILIVDDSPLTREYLSDAFSLLGHEIVAQADSPEAAVAAFELHRPDLVTLDLSLVGGDGFAALEGIRALNPAARVVIVSANSQKKAFDKLLQAGACGVIAKPIKLADLQALFTGPGT
jgi:DNA-binding NarL/FixJ family response regulator